MTERATSGIAETHGVTAIPDRLWVAMLARALPAVVIALIITFSQESSVEFGFVAFGVFALVSGMLIGFEAIGVRGHPVRGLTFARSIVSVLAGGAALVSGVVTHVATTSSFIWHLAAWAFVTGAIELVSAWLSRRFPLFSRELLISGALTVLLGALVAIVPPELNESYGGVEHVEGALTAIMQITGFFGAYLAILAVVLIIEGITLRGITRRSAAITGGAGSPAVADTGGGVSESTSASPAGEGPEA